MSGLTQVSIEDDYTTYALQVLPQGAPKGQLIGTRRAFFAGAYALLLKFKDIGSSSPEEREAIAKWEKELDEFFKDVAAGRK